MKPKSSSEPARVLATDARPLLLRGLVSAIDSEPVLEVVGTATDYDLALRMAGYLQPDLVVFSMFADPIKPLDALQALVHRCRATVLLLRDPHDNPALVAQALEAGATGIVSACESADGIVKAIQHAAQARWLFDTADDDTQIQVLPNPPSAHQEIRPEEQYFARLAARLTARELEVIRAIVANPSAKYIAIGALLNVSEHTVHNHLTSIYQKLHLVNRTGLLHYALTNQIVSPLAGSGFA